MERRGSHVHTPRTHQKRFIPLPSTIIFHCQAFYSIANSIVAVITSYKGHRNLFVHALQVELDRNFKYSPLELYVICTASMAFITLVHHGVAFMWSAVYLRDLLLETFFKFSLTIFVISILLEQRNVRYPFSDFV